MPNLDTSWFFNTVAGRFALLATMVFVIITCVKLLQRVVSPRIADRELRYRTRKVIGGLGFVLIFAGSLLIFGAKLSDLALTAGVATAGLAFALQEVIASFAGYIAISFGGFFKIGERVQLGGIKGDVIDISPLRTTVMELGQWVDGDLYNGRIVRIANSFVFKEPVFNYSGDFPYVWDEMKFPIRYGSDMDSVRALLTSAATEACGQYVEQAKAGWTHVQTRYSVEAASLDALVTLSLTDNWVEFTLRYVVPFDKRRITRDRLSVLVLHGVEQSNGAIQLGTTTMDVTIRKPEG